MTSSTLPRAQLFCREGNSDKEYHAAIEAQGTGYLVTFAFGRRGSTLKPGTKTAAPVSLDDAVKVYERLVGEKLGKGYRHAETPVGTPYVSPSGMTKAADSFAVQLLEPVEHPDRYLRDAAWIAQPKYDGIRLLVKLSGGTVTAQNRKGLDRGFPAVFGTALLDLGQDDLVLDGEAVGDRFHAFDLLRLDGHDTRGLRYADRLDLLRHLLDGETGAITLADTARSQFEKTAMYDRLTEDGAEGMVFKHVGAPYVGKRTDRQVKLKFWASATVVVIARNDTAEQLTAEQIGVPVPVQKGDGQRSVQMGLIHEGRLVFVGDVTIPPNRPVPAPGQLAEVKYLYAFPDSHKLIQAIYLGTRDDVDAADCVLAQLKHKAPAAA